ncbi:hypothetical protein VE00_02180 [Pseudogymnoascus sp. WSF 3629]|nr:hypothetical protein VE00_02180 [Pseudogymnoascus sp. WSF 3629]
MDTAPVPKVADGLIDALTSGVITITVGKEDDTQATFTVHKKLFQGKAPIFNKMFGGSFLEGVTGSATLPNDDHEAFEVFMEWLYRNTLTSLALLSKSKSVNAVLRLKIAKTMVFADKYCLDELSDRAMSIWFQGRGRTLLAGELETITAYVVDNSAPTCRARSYLARMWAKEIRSHSDGEHYKVGQSGLDTFINDDSFVTQVFNHIGALQSFGDI